MQRKNIEKLWKTFFVYAHDIENCSFISCFILFYFILINYGVSIIYYLDTATIIIWIIICTK